MRNSVESLLGESYSLNKLHYKKAARVMHYKVLFIIPEVRLYLDLSSQLVLHLCLLQLTLEQNLCHPQSVSLHRRRCEAHLDGNNKLALLLSCEVDTSELASA